MLFPTLKKKIVVKKKSGGGSVDFFLTSSPAAPKARDGRYCNAPRPSVCLSVCPSRLVFALQLKNALMYFSKLCRYVHHVMGVCCIVFDIDGMLFEFFMNFLNIEKIKF